MGRGTQHVDVEELCYVVVPLKGVLLSEGGADGGRLLLDESAFICDGLLK